MENNNPPKLTQAERTKLSKARIIQEANRLFGENGFYGARMSDIAEAAGLTMPGLLHHYANKEKLFIAVLENRDRSDQQYYETLFQASDKNDILGSLQALVEYNQKIPEMVRMFTVLSAESTLPGNPGKEFFILRYRFFRQQYLTYLKEAQNQGKIRAGIDVDQLGTLIMAVMDGLQIQWLIDPDQVDMVNAFRVLSQIFEHALQETPRDSE